MAFNPGQKLSADSVNAFSYGSSSPATIQFNDKMYVFYNNSNDDGIWYTFTEDGQTWSELVGCRHRGALGMGVAKNTSPCPLVYRNKLYLFYNGSGNDGTWYTVLDPSKTPPEPDQDWSIVYSVRQIIGSMGYQANTSPAAAVFQGQIWLFWSGSGGDGIWFSTYDDIYNWRVQHNLGEFTKGIGILPATSPAATTLDGIMYVFYTGSGKDGTWYVSYSMWKFGPGWTSPAAMRDKMGGGGGVQDGTSPSVVNNGDGYGMRLLYTDYVSGQWTPQQYLNKQGVSPSFKNGTNACGLRFMPAFNDFIFWIDNNNILSYTSGKVLKASDANLPSTTLQFFLNQHPFTLEVDDEPVSDFVGDKLGTGSETFEPVNAQNVVSPFLVTEEDVTRLKKAMRWSDHEILEVISLSGILGTPLVMFAAGHAVNWVVRYFNMHQQPQQPQQPVFMFLPAAAAAAAARSMFLPAANRPEAVQTRKPLQVEQEWTREHAHHNGHAEERH
ncbi:MAG: hypothetical protein M1831_004423 [Alyxoria varia]|nr:MAG: hypothetical protein M1831_004423 [Alyxoria varia]